jgi:spore coat polysaccharide biosynthesis predicted glycosyltransferase SpsG
MTTPEISEREKLIEHLMSAEFMSQGIYFDASNEAKGYCRWNINKVIDFIIADRARVVEKYEREIKELSKNVVSIDLDAPIDEKAVKATKNLFDESLRRAGRAT